MRDSCRPGLKTSDIYYNIPVFPLTCLRIRSHLWIMKASQMLFVKILRGPDETLPVYWPVHYLQAFYPLHQKSGLGYCFAPFVEGERSHHPSRGEPAALLLYPTTLQSSILSVCQTADRKSYSHDKGAEHLQRHRGAGPEEHVHSLLPPAKAGMLQEENQLWPALPLGMYI